MKKLIWKNVWQTLAAIVFLIGAWLVAYFYVGNELLVPPLSESVKEFGKNVFFESPDLIIRTPKGSPAEIYARQNQLRVEYP